MIVESRYVEYSRGKRVYACEWSRHWMAPCPEGCLDVGIRRVDALKRVRESRERDKKEKCSNFEYRAVDI